MARCTVCGEKAGFLMSMCKPCIAKYQEEKRAQQLAEAEQAEQAQQAILPAPVDQTCSRCGNPMEALAQLPLRTGGTTGGWHIVFGQLADAEEEIVTLDFFRCRQCRRVEFFDLDLSIPRPGR